jgi:branched-chain amino acid transport system ATP-binding protein
MALLSLESLSKAYGALVVTDAVSLDVPEGEILGVLGPNGAGKTTLFNLIAGTTQPDFGRVMFDGLDITRRPAAERCRLGISRSFQVPNPFGGMTVFENALVGATFGRAPRDSEAQALRALDITGMKSKANALAGGLTLLDRKRLEMARALATQPRLLLLDEIAGGLTEGECQELVAAIRKIHAAGTTIIWIEHIVHALLAVVSRLVVLNFGRMIAQGDPREVMDSAEVREIYLGSPI